MKLAFEYLGLRALSFLAVIILEGPAEGLGGHLLRTHTRHMKETSRKIWAL